jgi:hypothetical protein
MSVQHGGSVGIRELRRLKQSLKLSSITSTRLGKWGGKKALKHMAGPAYLNPPDRRPTRLVRRSNE